MKKTKENLTEEEKAAIERAEQFIKDRKKIPTSERTPISNPEKYSFPIGINDEGELNVVTGRSEDESE